MSSLHAPDANAKKRTASIEHEAAKSSGGVTASVSRWFTSPHAPVKVATEQNTTLTAPAEDGKDVRSERSNSSSVFRAIRLQSHNPILQLTPMGLESEGDPESEADDVEETDPMLDPAVGYMDEDGDSFISESFSVSPPLQSSFRCRKGVVNMIVLHRFLH